MIATLACLLIAKQTGSELVSFKVRSGAAAYQTGKPFLVSLDFKPDPGWHIYWVNPGDAGAPTTVKWDLPKGWKAEPLGWPAPEVLDADGIVSYGYSEGLSLLYKLFPAGSGQVKVGISASWLVCKEACMPGKGATSLQLSSGDKPSDMQSKLVTLAGLLPKSYPHPIKLSYSGNNLSIALPGGSDSKPYFFVEQPGLLDHSKPQTYSNGFLTIPLQTGSNKLGSLSGFLKTKEGTFRVPPTQVMKG